MLSQVGPDGTVEEWDVEAGVYRVRRNGTVVQRPLTDAELEWLEAGHPGDPARVETLRRQGRRAYVQNRAFLLRPAPNYPLSQSAQRALVAQTVALTRQTNGIIRLLLGRDMLGVPDDVVTWTCDTGTPLSEDGRTFTFDVSAAPFSPWVGGALGVYRVVSRYDGAGEYTAALTVHDGATVYAAGTQTGLASDLDDSELRWVFDGADIPAGTVLDDVRLTITCTGTLAVQWQSLCVDSEVPE
jgi:hypothetical protein